MYSQIWLNLLENDCQCDNITKLKRKGRKKRTKIGNHPQELLAKFGYRPDMKVNNLRILLYFGYILELVVEILFVSKSYLSSWQMWKFGPHKMVKDYPKAKKTVLKWGNLFSTNLFLENLAIFFTTWSL